MSLYSIESQRLGLAKEASRGTAESAPSKWYPTRGIAQIDYALNHINDDALRGIYEKYPMIAGIKTGEAKIPLYLDAQMAGEFFYSLLGSVSSSQQGGTAAYKHTIVRSSSISPIAYTLFLDRGMNVMKYNLGCVKKIALKSSVDGLIEMDVDALFKTEASGSIGSPSFPTQRYLSFQHVDFKIAGSSNTDVKEWSLSVDNGARAHRTLSGSQDLSDIVSPSKLNIDGSFTIYFQNTTERDKFLANTTSAIRVLMVGSTIASTYKYTVDVNVYAANYKAFPYGEDQGLLAAKATFEGVYSSSDSKALQVDVTNTDTAY